MLQRLQYMLLDVWILNTKSYCLLKLSHVLSSFDVTQGYGLGPFLFAPHFCNHFTMCLPERSQTPVAGR